MKVILLKVVGLFTITIQAHPLVGTVWTHHISPRCINKLTFKQDNKIIEYDCELDYKFNGIYFIKDNILNITIADDSHSEDGGKIVYYKEKYIISSKGLYHVNYKLQNQKKSKERISNNIWWHRVI